MSGNLGATMVALVEMARMVTTLPMEVAVVVVVVVVRYWGGVVAGCEGIPCRVSE